MLKDEFCTPEGSRCVILRGRGGACLTCGGARPTLSYNAHNLLLRNESISCAQQKFPCPGNGNPLLVGRYKVDSVNPPRIHRKLIDSTYLQTTTYGARGEKTSKQHRNATSLWSYLIWTYRKKVVTTQVVLDCEATCGPSVCGIYFNTNLTNLSNCAGLTSYKETIRFVFL